jgi:hypothetical protein
MIAAGLVSNPVYLLDMSLLFPAAGITGVFLLKHREWGYVMAPTLVMTFVLISAGIVAGVVVLIARGLDASPGVAVGIGVIGIIESLVLGRFLKSIRPAAKAAAIS